MFQALMYDVFRNAIDMLLLIHAMQPLGLLQQNILSDKILRVYLKFNAAADNF